MPPVHVEAGKNTRNAALYQKSKGVKLDPLEHRLIDAIEGRPFTFYEIIDRRPGIGYRVKDFFLSDIFEKIMRPPEMQNTDGDSLCFHTLYYDIESPDVAFKALKSLSAIETEEGQQNGLPDAGTQLNPLYIGFTVELLNKIARRRKLDIQRGRMEIWAAAIV